MSPGGAVATGSTRWRSQIAFLSLRRADLRAWSTRPAETLLTERHRPRRQFAGPLQRRVPLSATPATLNQTEPLPNKKLPAERDVFASAHRSAAGSAQRNP